MTRKFRGPIHATPIYGCTSTRKRNILGNLLSFLQHLGTNVFFRPHYDDSVHDTVTGAKSEWTILIYLTGIEDGVEGGQVGPHSEIFCQSSLINKQFKTLFYKEEKGKASETISPPLKRGSALLHR